MQARPYRRCLNLSYCSTVRTFNRERTRMLVNRRDTGPPPTRRTSTLDMLNSMKPAHYGAASCFIGNYGPWRRCGDFSLRKAVSAFVPRRKFLGSSTITVCYPLPNRDDGDLPPNRALPAALSFCAGRLEDAFLAQLQFSVGFILAARISLFRNVQSLS